MKFQLSSRQKKVLPVLFILSLTLSLFIGIQIGRAQSPPDVSLSDAGISVTGDVTANNFLLLNGSAIGGGVSGNVTAENFDGIYPSGAYSYMIFPVEGSSPTIYAAKSSNGSIIDLWTSTNASSVFENAVGANKTILIKSGNYVGWIHLDGSDNGLRITGESGATISLPDDTNESIIQIYNTNGIPDGIEIDHLRLNGNYQGQSILDVLPDTTLNCITVRNAINTYIHDNTMEYGTYHGIAVIGSVGPPTVFNNNTRIENNVVRYNRISGVMATNSLYRLIIDHNSILDNSLGAHAAVSIDALGPNTGNSEGVQITNNIVGYDTIGYGASVGIYLFGSHSSSPVSYATGNIISGNTVFNYDPAMALQAIRIDDADGNIISNNQVFGKNGGGIYWGITLINSNNNTVSNNQIDLVWNEGISLQSSNNNLLEGNQITRTRWGDYQSHYGVNVTGTSAYNLIDSVKIDWVGTASSMAGISFSVATNNNRVKDAMVTHASTPITDLGTSNIFSNSEMDPLQLGNLGVVGTPITITMKETVAAGDLLFQNATGIFKASATSTATMLVYAMAIQAISANAQGLAITNGFMRNNAWTSMTVGATAYASTAGVPTTTAPNTSGNVIQDLGKANAAKILDFTNSGAWGTHV